MLYYIDESCVEALSSGDREAAEFLEQLVMHRRKCKNMLLATRKVFDELSKSENLASFAREYYRILRNRSSENKLILERHQNIIRWFPGTQGIRK